jgi:hypothetical protein
MKNTLPRRQRMLQKNRKLILLSCSKLKPTSLFKLQPNTIDNSPKRRSESKSKSSPVIHKPPTKKTRMRIMTGLTTTMIRTSRRIQTSLTSRNWRVKNESLSDLSLSRRS